MNKIIFVEGLPGSGKTTLVHELMKTQNMAKCWRSVYSADVIPRNMVREKVKHGQSLTIEEARFLYRSRAYDVYLKEHLSIWEKFCRENETMSQNLIVDAGLIQAPLYELIGLYMLSNEEILAHIQRIWDLVKESFVPELIYLKTDSPSACIRTAIRMQKEQRKQWVSGFCRWLEVAPYPMKKQYSGIRGIEMFVEDRYQVDCFLLHNLKANKKIRYRKII